MVSNSFFQRVINATLAPCSAAAGATAASCSATRHLTALYKVGRVPGGDYQNFGNKIMTTLGLASVVYTLGTSDAKIFTVKNAADFTVA